ncbi:hypothetical protein [Microbulbifer sp. SSSA005]|uniref:hypothetical protein n=2 Tax=Microbulbifer TaxID=48073 RepID=UPI00403A1C3E
MTDLKIGDWVRTIKAGLWQIYRIDEFNCINPMTEKVEDKTLVFIKRFINDSGKRSFTQDVYSPEVIFQLSSEELNELEEFISEHQDIYDKFTSFQPKPINSVYSRGIKIPEDRTSDEIANLIPKDEYFTQTEIVDIVDNLGYDTKSYPQWTIQFLSEGTQLVDGYVRYRFNKVFEF